MIKSGSLSWLTQLAYSAETPKDKISKLEIIRACMAKILSVVYDLIIGVFTKDNMLILIVLNAWIYYLWAR